ncbi:MAG: rod shape-determining protein MreD [Patescibacteria group bacterium]|nr:rod shape-determining protein MreD [Patescibacteria group bacterium]
MRIAISIISLILLAFLQISFLPNFIILGSIPNLILIVAIAWCIAGNFKEAIFWGIAGGIILDLFSPFYFGIISLTNLAVISLVYFIAKNIINSDDRISVAAICAIATLLYNFFLIFFILIAKLVKLDDLIQPFNFSFLLTIFVQMIFNTIIISLIYNYVKSIQEVENYYEQRRQIKA